MLFTKNSILAILEAAYRGAQSEELWLRSILEASRSTLDRGLGLQAFFIDILREDNCRAYGFVGVGGDTDESRKRFNRWVEVTPPSLIYYCFTLHKCGFRSQLPDCFARHSVTVDKQVYEHSVATAGWREMCGYVALDGAGYGCALFSPQVKFAKEPRNDRVVDMWLGIASHISAALNLQRKRVLEGSAFLDRAAVILDPDGRILHVDATAQSRLAMGALRDAVRRMDLARTRRNRYDAAEILRLWHALVDGRFLLIDQFDHDGRRYVVVRQNDTPSALLNERERQVVGVAARGHSNKFIAYELGISPSSVARHLARVAQKIGVTSRVELIRAFAGSMLDFSGKRG